MNNLHSIERKLIRKRLFGNEKGFALEFEILIK